MSASNEDWHWDGWWSELKDLAIVLTGAGIVYWAMQGRGGNEGDPMVGYVRDNQQTMIKMLKEERGIR